MKTALVFALPLLLATQALWAQDANALLAETRKTALPVLPKIVKTMQTAVKEQGLVAAVSVCKEKAPQLL